MRTVQNGSGLCIFQSSLSSDVGALDLDNILSQEEIDALLSAFSQEEEDESAQAKGLSEARQVRPYDFRRPDKFSKDQLRVLEMIHETFARSLSPWMSSYFRIPVKVSLNSVSQLSFDEFSSSLELPSVTVVFYMEPPGDRGIAWMSPDLASAVLDRCLGGPGRSVAKARELTNIEEGILRGVMVRILDMLAMAWEQMTQVTFSLSNLASGPQFAQITSGTETVGRIDLRITLGDSSGDLRLCFPYPLLQPIIPRLAIERWFRRESDLGKDAEAGETLRRRLSLVEVPVVLEVGRATISVSEFLDLEVGDVIKLDSRYGKDLVVRVGGGKKFLARPGVVGRRLAFQVNSVVRDRGGTLK